MTRYFIFEGCDYTGKTLCAQMFKEFLELKGYDTIYTKEPGSPYSQICMKIRELILNHADIIKHKETYSYLFAADSYEHMVSVVWPAINSGKIVISDRCMLSDYAYRHDLIHDKIRDVNLNLLSTLEPYIVWMRSTQEVILNRYISRQDTNKFEEVHVLNNIDKISRQYNAIMNRRDILNKFKDIKAFDNNENVTEIFMPLFDQLIKEIDT